MTKQTNTSITVAEEEDDTLQLLAEKQAANRENEPQPKSEKTPRKVSSRAHIEEDDTLQLIAEKQAANRDKQHQPTFKKTPQEVAAPVAPLAAANDLARRRSSQVEAAEAHLVKKQSDHFHFFDKKSAVTAASCGATKTMSTDRELQIGVGASSPTNETEDATSSCIKDASGAHQPRQQNHVPRTQLRLQTRLEGSTHSQPGAFHHSPSLPLEDQHSATMSDVMHRTVDDEESQSLPSTPPPPPQPSHPVQVATEGLVEATPLPQEPLQSAEPVQQEQVQPKETGGSVIHRNKLWLLFLLLVAVVFIAVGLSIFFVVGKSSDGSNNLEVDPTKADTTQATTSTSQSDDELIILDLPINSLLSESTMRIIQQDIQGTTSQSMAYKWVQNDPWLTNYSNDRLLQRFAAATLFYETNGNTWVIIGGGVVSVPFGRPPKTAGGEGPSGDGRPKQSQANQTGTNNNRPNNNFSFQGFVNVTSNAWLSYGTDECTWFSRPLRPDIIEREGEDANWLCGLNGTSWRHLRLARNNLTNQLPKEIGLLTNLETLDFNGNHLQGSIPRQIGLLTKLRHLTFKDNNLQGTIPSQIGLLSNSLKAIGSNNNHLLMGTLPEEFWMLSHLSGLSIPRNQISGTIPNYIPYQMPYLKELILAGNLFHGTLPSTLGLCQNIANINLADLDQLVGGIPTELGLLNNTLKKFNIRGTSLSGTIPEQLCDTVIELDFDCSKTLCGCDCPCQ